MRICARLEGKFGRDVTPPVRRVCRRSSPALAATLSSLYVVFAANPPVAAGPRADRRKTANTRQVTDRHKSGFLGAFQIHRAAQ